MNPRSISGAARLFTEDEKISLFFFLHMNNVGQILITIRFEDEPQTPTGDGNELGGGGLAEDLDVRRTEAHRGVRRLQGPRSEIRADRNREDYYDKRDRLIEITIKKHVVLL